VTFGTRAVFFFVTISAFAQEPADSSGARRLTLDEALALAEQNNPRLRVSTAGIEGATGAVSTARAYPNPTFGIGVLGRQTARAPGQIPGWLNSFTVTQPVELPGVRRTRIEAAEQGKQSSQYAFAETRLEVRGFVKQAFYEAMRRNQEVELARGNLQLLEDLKRRIEVQVKVGEAARLEFTRADAELAAARIQLQSAELRRSAALAALYAAVGTPLGNVMPAGPLSAPAVLPPIDALRAEVLGKHPAIAFAESETRRAEANLDHERALRAPQPSLWADALVQPDVGQYRYGVQLDLPFWNRRRGPIAEAAAAQRQAAAFSAQRRLEISAMLERAYSQYQIASQQLESFEAGTLRVAEAAVQASEAAFRFGERSVLEILDAQRVLRAARLDYLNAQFDRQQALIELEQLGALGDKP
jgi:outer membrane protein, heavy metal efflux system